MKPRTNKSRPAKIRHNGVRGGGCKNPFEPVPRKPLKQNSRSLSISRGGKSSDFATVKRRKMLPERANWPLSSYEQTDRDDLLRLKPDEMKLLSEVGQKALAVLLRSHLDQDFIADGLDHRHVSPALREKMKGQIQRTQRLAIKAPNNSHLQKLCQ